MNSNDAAMLWEKAAKQLGTVLHPDVFGRWISIIQPVAVQDDTLSLSVDNDFYKTWLEEHYLTLIRNAVAAVSGSEFKVVFGVKSVGQPAAGAAPVAAPAPRRRTLRERLSGRPRECQSLNEKFTFEAFIVGPCNSFAHAASLAVAQAPARAYNPLFIYGGVGLGKTHLMQAIGHYVQKNSRANVRYLSCEAFTNEYISSLQSNTIVQFRKKYRSVDLLLIDDIHFLAGKEGLQEEFFHTFNTLFDAHKQIVMTSDRPASQINGLEQRLVSRFEWGLVTEMEPPDVETRIAILRHKLARSKAAMSDETVSFIAQNIKRNIRRLEGALIRVISYASLSPQPLSPEGLRHLLRDTIDEEREEAVSFGAIQKAVCEFYDVRLVDLTGPRRPQAIAFPRQVAMYLCRRLTTSSLPEIAGAFGKTHATVLHACRVVDRRLLSDKSLGQNVSKIASQLGKTL